MSICTICSSKMKHFRDTMHMKSKNPPYNSDSQSQHKPLWHRQLTTHLRITRAIAITDRQLDIATMTTSLMSSQLRKLSTPCCQLRRYIRYIWIHMAFHMAARHAVRGSIIQATYANS